MSYRIPADWRVMPFNALVDPVTRTETVSPDKEYRLIGVRWYIEGAHIHDVLPGSDIKTTLLSRVEEDDIIYNKMWASKAAFAIAKRRHHNTYCTTEYPQFRANPHNLCVKFLEYVFHLPRFLYDATALCRGTTGRARLNPKDFLKIEIPIPPLPEQHKIAEFLGEWDRAITLTENLIKAKQYRKKALMQQLLTGENRFEEFEGEQWRKARIKDVAQIKSGSTPLRSKADRYFANGSIPWVKTMDLTDGKITDTDEKITEMALRETSCPLLDRGTVLVAMYGGFNQIGRTGILTFKGSINQAISALIVNSRILVPDFLLYWLNANVHLWRRFAASSRKDPNITKNDVALFPIQLPSLAEQRKISAVFQACDEEIELLGQKLAALKQQKKGLMQQLLTGRVRVVPLSSSPRKREDWGDRTAAIGEHPCPRHHPSAKN